MTGGDLDYALVTRQVHGIWGGITETERRPLFASRTQMTKMSDLLPNVSLPGSPLARRAAVVSCWLCGIRLHQNQMVPDGGSACLDLRWYCKDIRACTERWTSAQRQRRAAEAAPPGKADQADAADIMSGGRVRQR